MCHCIDESIESSITQPILSYFAIEMSPRQKRNENPNFNLYKSMNISLIIMTTFYFDDDKKQGFFHSSNHKLHSCTALLTKRTSSSIETIFSTS